MIESILVVCTGNICRSPVGERILASLCPKISVPSAGIGVLVGQAVDKDAAAVAQSRDVDIEGHSARQITAEILAKHDLILVMGPEHRNYIGSNFPHASGKTMLFDKWELNQGNEDPYKRSTEFHELVFDAINRSAQSWAKRLSGT